MKRYTRKAAATGFSFWSNPILDANLPVWRSRFVLFALFFAFLALAGRALWLGTVSNEFLQSQGEIRYSRTLSLPATRGKITDRNGHVLASSLPVKAIWAVPADAAEADAASMRALERLLGMSDEEMQLKLHSRHDFVYLRRQVDADIAAKITALRIPGIETRREYKRFYPEGELFAHVVGFTGVEDTGQDGMELSSEKTLAGVAGSRRVIKDRLGHVIDDIGAMQEAHDGKDIALSIDSNIQYIAFTQLKQAVETFKAKAGGIVVVDTRTGEVLALANLPTYNPNDRSLLSGDQLRNRVITDTFEPGSTLKPFTIAAALNDHVVTPASVFQTAPGKLRIGTATISDSHAHGPLTVAQIIEKSSNIGTAKVALELPAQRMWEMFTQVGFGQSPKLGFPGAAAGRLRPVKSWRPIEQATMSYGHGISVSLIQLAHAYTIFARNGDVIPLSITRVAKPPVGQQVISAQTAKDMRDMLETVVSQEGTAPKAQVPGFRVGGKTGTAYKVVHGRYVHQYVASFVGFAPASNPRIIVAVMLDEPTAGGHFGGDVAGPVFSTVTANTLRTLNIAPDAPMAGLAATGKQHS
jgi:cell division protein FtsI (penicillin-binding protein 3)